MQPARGRSSADLALVVGGTLLAYVLTPYRVHFEDHHLKVPFMLKAWDPTLFAGDPTIALYESYTVLAWRLIHPLTGLMGIEATFLLLHSASLALLFAAVIAIARTLSQRAWVTPLAVLLVVGKKYVAGGIWTWDQSLLARHIAFPLLLWAVWSVLNRRWYLAAILWAVGFNLHPVIGISGWLTTLAFALPHWRTLASPVGARAAALAVILACPVLVLRALGSGSGTMNFIDPEWLALVRLENADHFFPSTYGWTFIGANLGFSVLLALGTRHIEVSEHRHGMLILAASLPMAFIVSYLFGELLPIQFIMLSSPLRLARFVVVLGSIALAIEACSLWRHSPEMRWLLAGTTVLVAIEYRKKYFVALIAAWLVAASLQRLQTVRRRTTLALGLVLVLLGLRHAWAHRTGLWGDPVVAIATASMVLAALPVLLRRWSPGPSFLVGLLAAGLFFYAGNLWSRGGGLIDADLPGFRHRTPLLQAAEWARDHSPPNSLFITDPAIDFRAFGRRGVVATRRDGTYANLSRDFASEWYARMRELCRGPHIDENGCAFRRHDAESLTALAHRWGATHVLVDGSHPTLEMQEVYENPQYRIYRIPEP